MRSARPLGSYSETHLQKLGYTLCYLHGEPGTGYWLIGSAPALGPELNARPVSFS